MNMKNLPIKKGIEELLEKERNGIWEIKDRNQYLKVTSELDHHPIRIPLSEYENLKDAVADAVRCAKVYKKLIAIGLYHPNTEIVIFKDDENYLSLMVAMPKLGEIEYDTSSLVKKIVAFPALYTIRNKISNFKAKLGLKEKDWWDLDPLFNWGADEKSKIYAHDLHICNILNKGEMYSQILKLADELEVG